jgi:hypothetical protein
MQRLRLAFSAFSFAAVGLAPAAAFAQLPTCADLATNPAYGLAGNPTVLQVNATTPLTTFVTAGVTVPYCRVDFVVSERGGTGAGYASGQNQRVVLRVGLPANSSNLGTGGGFDGEGAWNGKVQNLGGGGLVGNVGNVTAATNARYVGSSTDSGHPASEGNTFGVIQETHELNLGKIGDFFSESLRLQYQWALRLAEVYYGRPANRNYWNGCSTGGRQGLVLATQYGNDFDGFLIGAPHTNHVKNSTSGAFRQWTNKELAGGSVTDEKVNAFIAKAINQCDAQDGLVDSILSEPRTCTARAALNLCGAPGAPTDPALCLTPAEVTVIDKAFDGARNDLGKRVWFPSGYATSGSLEVPANGLGGNGPFLWAKRDITFDWVNLNLPLSEWDNLHELATNNVSQYVDMGSPNLDLAKNNGAKILMWHGLADNQIPFRSNIYYYSRVIDQYGAADLSDWYRFFLAPGVGHCGGGNGPQPQQLFERMVAWSEGGPAPDTILASNTTAGVVTRTRPLCPFPQTAIYNGTGDPNSAASFQCGGNIQTKAMICDGLIVKHQHETGTAMEPLNGENDISCGFASMPVTTAELERATANKAKGTPSSPPGLTAIVTLTATDADNDIVLTEYSVDGGPWTTATGPFPVTGQGQHVLEYRSIDKAEHVEPTKAVNFRLPLHP